MKNLFFQILLSIFVCSTISGQTISVITNDKNPFIHAFSMHDLPALTSISIDVINNNSQKPFYEIITIFGDGQFSKDSILSGPKKEGAYHFSSPINYTSHLYPSSSNYPIDIILKARNVPIENELLINDLTIPDIALIEDHGMCNTSSTLTLSKQNSIKLNTLKVATDSSDYQCVTIRFLSYIKPSTISLSYDHEEFKAVSQSIPNIVGAIQNYPKSDQLGKTMFTIGKIPRFSQFEPQELVIYKVLQKLNKSIKPTYFKVEYLDQNNQLLAIDSILSNFSHANTAEVQKEKVLKNKNSNPKRERFSDMSIVDLLLNNWSVILVGILVILFLVYIIKKYKPF